MREREPIPFPVWRAPLAEYQQAFARYHAGAELWISTRGDRSASHLFIREEH